MIAVFYRSAMLIGILFLFMLPGAHAHPGGTDSSGGHACRSNCARWGLSPGEYHHHGSRVATPAPPPRRPPILRDAWDPDGSERQESSRPPARSRLIGPAPDRPSASPPGSFEAKIWHVVDADTFWIRRRDKSLRIHLLFVDAPELSQPFGEKAKAQVENWLADRTVTITTLDVDRDGDRWVQIQLSPQRYLGQQLLDQGLAWRRPGYAPDWHENENQARQRHQGLWRAADPMAPWLWRQQQPNGRN